MQKIALESGTSSSGFRSIPLKFIQHVHSGQNAETNVDSLPSIEAQFQALELKASEHYDAWLRAKAEGENIRRRAQEDIAKVITGLQIADVDAGTGAMTVTLSVAHGTISLAAGTGVTLTTNGTSSVQLSGTVTAINALLATASAVTYTPTQNYNGADTLTVLTSDGGNTGSGGTLTATSTVGITVTSVNDAPVITTEANSLSTTEDTSTSFVISTQLSGKVTDADGTALKGIVIVQNTSSIGTWAYSTDGTTWVEFPTTYLGTIDWAKVMYLNASDRLRYTPAANTNGTDIADLNFRAVDATFPNTASGTQVNANNIIGGSGAISGQPGHFTVSVSAVNDAPVVTTSTTARS